MKPVIYLVLVAALFGCGYQYRYYKPGASTQQHYKDDYECRQEARYQQSGAVLNSYGGMAASSQAIDDDMYFACMRARGYTITFE